jgi:hypothetical protein
MTARLRVHDDRDGGGRRFVGGQQLAQVHVGD